MILNIYITSLCHVMLQQVPARFEDVVGSGNKPTNIIILIDTGGVDR